jgi:hypothetical protein
LDGSVIMARSEVNHCFYGRPVLPQELLSGRVPPPRAAAPLYDALAEAMSSLPNVRHVRHTAFSGEGSDEVAERRKSVLMAPPEPAGEAGADRTSQTIQDIDDLLRDSGYGGEGSLKKGDSRRRTVAYGSQYAAAASGIEVVQDEVWGTSSTYSVTETAADVDRQSAQPRWGTSGGEASGKEASGSSAAPDAVADDQAAAMQRRGRPRSLPETRSDAIGDRAQRSLPAEPLQVARQGSTDAEAMLGDVPKPSSSKRVPSLVDEELECVTANVNALVG